MTLPSRLADGIAAIGLTIRRNPDAFAALRAQKME
jgi:hypothetical protein